MRFDYVAVQHINTRDAIVYGIGETPALALDDARRYCETMDGITVYPCTDLLADAIERGYTVDCVVVDGKALYCLG